MYIGLSLGDQIDVISTLTRFCIMVSIAVVLLGGSLGALVVQRTLSPLKRIEKTAAKIAAGDLSQRVPESGESTEIGSLARSLNSMLTQIERSFHEQEAVTQKMRQFVSDASHELRTPSPPFMAMPNCTRCNGMRRGRWSGRMMPSLISSHRARA